VVGATPHPSPSPGVGQAVDQAAAGVLAHPPSAVLVLAAGVVAGAMAIMLWPVFGHLVTMAHEGGHALLVLALGGRVERVVLQRDQTGATLHRGALVSLPVTAAGYIGPSLFGLGGALALAHGGAGAVLWISIGLLAVLFLAPMNLFGRFVVLLAGGGLLLTVLHGSSVVQELVATGWIWLLLIGGVVQVLQDGRRASDFHALRRSTYVVPATIWAGFALVVTVAALVAGGALMLGAVPSPV
jgi:Peptidase M50B-like